MILISLKANLIYNFKNLIIFVFKSNNFIILNNLKTKIITFFNKLV